MPQRYIVVFVLANVDPRVRGRNFTEETVRARMSVDIVKQLEKAQRFVEKSRIDEAIEAYQEILLAVPNHLESLQSLGDLCTMQKRPDRAAAYYGMLFDRLTAPREEPKAVALYVRFLKPHQQPPERVSRFALLLQKQNRSEEAIEQFTSAALAYELGGKGDDALACFVRITQLDSGEPRPPRLRVFDQQQKLIAIAEAVVPRTYQPTVVFDPLP